MYLFLSIHFGSKVVQSTLAITKCGVCSYLGMASLVESFGLEEGNNEFVMVVEGGQIVSHFKQNFGFIENGFLKFFHHGEHYECEVDVCVNVYVDVYVNVNYECVCISCILCILYIPYVLYVFHILYISCVLYMLCILDILYIHAIYE